MTKKKDDDSTALRLKLEEAHRLVAEYERHIETIRAKCYVDAVTQNVTDAPQLLVNLKEAMKPLVATGFVVTLVEGDIQRTRTQLGTKYRQQLEACWREVQSRSIQVANLKDQAPGSERFAKAVIMLAVAILGFLEITILPPRMLRDELMSRLKQRGDSKVPTEGQRKRAARDHRIRELSKLHGTESPAEILQIAQNDPTIAALSVRLSTEIVSNVIKPRRPRRSGRKTRVKK